MMKNENKENKMNSIACTTPACTHEARVAVVDEIDYDYVMFLCVPCLDSTEAWVLGQSTVHSIAEYLSW